MELVKNVHQFLTEAVLCVIVFVPSCTMQSQNNSIMYYPLSIVYGILWLTNSTILTDRMILLHMSKLVPKLWLAFPFPRENI